MPSISDHPTGALDESSKSAPDEDTSSPLDDDDSARIRDCVPPLMDTMNIDEGAFEEADGAMPAEGARAGSWACAEEDEEEGEEDRTRDERLDPAMEASLRRGVYATLLQSDSEPGAGCLWGTASNGNSEEQRTPSMTSARSTPSPTAFSPHPPHAPSRQSLEQLRTEIHRLRELLRERQRQLHQMTIQRDAAEARGILLQRQCAVLCHRLNAMPLARGERRFSPFPMSYMQAVRDAGAAARGADAAEGLEVGTQNRSAARRARRARHAVASTVFSGSLKTKTKAQLRDIASALRLSGEGTKKVVVERIQAHLDATPALADNPRFVGLRARRT